MTRMVARWCSRSLHGDRERRQCHPGMGPWPFPHDPAARGPSRLGANAQPPGTGSSWPWPMGWGGQVGGGLLISRVTPEGPSACLSLRSGVDVGVLGSQSLPPNSQAAFYLGGQGPSTTGGLRTDMPKAPLGCEALGPHYRRAPEKGGGRGTVGRGRLLPEPPCYASKVPSRNASDKDNTASEIDLRRRKTERKSLHTDPAQVLASGPGRRTGHVEGG